MNIVLSTGVRKCVPSSFAKWLECVCDVSGSLNIGSQMDPAEGICGRTVFRFRLRLFPSNSRVHRAEGRAP